MTIAKLLPRSLLAAAGLAALMAALPSTASAHHRHNDFRPRVVHPGPVYRHKAPGLRRVVVNTRYGRRFVWVEPGYRLSPRFNYSRHFYGRNGFRAGRYCYDGYYRR
ncbi:MAG: hypothetical protein AAFZ58_12795 [Pseudomonadota bacterium]